MLLLGDSFFWGYGVDNEEVISAVLPEREIQPLSEALLHEISSVARNAGADFLLVFIPQKENTPGGVTRYQGVRQGADLRNDDASRYLGQVTALNRYPYLDLLPLVRSRHARGEILYTPGGTTTTGRHRGTAWPPRPSPAHLPGGSPQPPAEGPVADRETPETKFYYTIPLFY